MCEYEPCKRLLFVNRTQLLKPHQKWSLQNGPCPDCWPTRRCFVGERPYCCASFPLWCLGCRMGLGMRGIHAGYLCHYVILSVYEYLTYPVLKCVELARQSKSHHPKWICYGSWLISVARFPYNWANLLVAFLANRCFRFFRIPRSGHEALGGLCEFGLLRSTMQTNQLEYVWEMLMDTWYIKMI